MESNALGSLIWELFGTWKSQFEIFIDCCNGQNPHLKGKVMQVVAYGATPFLNFDFSAGFFPKITGYTINS